MAQHADHVIAVGDKGLVLESPDGARHWERVVLEGKPPLIDVAACPDGSFFLIDFRRGLWSRSASGSAWRRTPIRLGAGAGDDLAPRALALTCDPSGRLWAVGEQSSILRSDDRGSHWRDTSPDRRDRLLTAIAFLDDARGRVVGEFGTYFETEDGGDVWTRGPDLPDDLYPQAAYFASDGRIWAVGNHGRIVRFDSSRGGGSGRGAWQPEPSGTRVALYGIARVGAQLVAVGAGGIGVSRELDTRADGSDAWQVLSWSPAQSGESAGYLRGIADLGERVFVTVGQGLALRGVLAAPRTAARSTP